MERIRLEYMLLLLLVGIISISTVLAAPTGPSSVNTVGSSRYSTANGAVVNATAGNVTELNISANSVTQTWQGYFGNITGTIVLGNSNNQTLYNWNLSSPIGQIYATRTSSVPTWTSVVCASDAQTTTEDTALGVNESVDQDSVNRTFLNTTAFNQFYVGGVLINSSQNCKAVNLFNSSGTYSTNFQEVLLHDGASMIYTGLITRDSTGFDNRSHDFEMLVGENGHNGDSTPTPYYFYVELR